MLLTSNFADGLVDLYEEVKSIQICLCPGKTWSHLKENDLITWPLQHIYMKFIQFWLPVRKTHKTFIHALNTQDNLQASLEWYRKKLICFQREREREREREIKNERERETWWTVWTALCCFMKDAKPISPWEFHHLNYPTIQSTSFMSGPLKLTLLKAWQLKGSMGV